MIQDEDAIIRQLDDAVRAPRAAQVLATLADVVEAELLRDTRARLAWRPVPLATYGSLPEGIESSWVFVLRANCTSGAERHPNSIQRFVSLRNGADMQTWNGRAWESNFLSSSPSGRLADRWLSIPVNVWHRPVMGPESWIVVSFHTASDEELIEERPEDDEHPDEMVMRSERYVGRSAR